MVSGRPAAACARVDLEGRSMNEDVSDGWAASAAAWIIEQGEDGDYGRRFVLDAPMLARIEGRGFRHALDVGCGEGWRRCGRAARC
jgi:hypothetical protein